MTRIHYRPLDWEPLEYGVRPIPFLEAQKFVIEHHYAHGMANATTGAFGLFEGKHLIGVLAFATPCSEAVRASVFGKEHVGRVTELHRLVILDVTPTNTESYFIARCLALLKERKPHLWSVVSFADEGAGHYGTIYQATNALYYGMSNDKRRRFFIDQTGRLRHQRQCGHHIDVKEGLLRGWEPVYRGPKHRYNFLLPDDKRHEKVIRGMRVLQKHDYPKKPTTMNGGLVCAL